MAASTQGPRRKGSHMAVVTTCAISDPGPRTPTSQAGPRSGPGADPLGSAAVNSTHSHRSEAMTVGTTSRRRICSPTSVRATGSAITLTPDTTPPQRAPDLQLRAGEAKEWLIRPRFDPGGSQRGNDRVWSGAMQFLPMYQQFCSAQGTITLCPSAPLTPDMPSCPSQSTSALGFGHARRAIPASHRVRS